MTISLGRADFQAPTAECNFFEDFVLNSLGISKELQANITAVTITVADFETSTS